ncbi:uncharacterized protein C11orf16 homolog [Spea bombifrons]|uniref:uncharacterized protein C11orf16 homolog n=1 Tax=Spea bombifrons TaxID=233779 RepID=UPI0023497C06|nr:uncharacterized protein C11orf16 homolog [Spea bombifrons]
MITVTYMKRVKCGSLCPDEESSCRPISFGCPSPVAPHTAVLARRQRDGFYYLATVKQEECRGVFLIEFDKPAGGRHQTQLQKTAADDLIPYYDALRRCIVPGDTVLSPWEPEQVRYGPGIVTLGLETRDPLRVTEDEELTVSFWNGKKARVPLGVAVWVSPSVYWRVMDALHQPIGSRQAVQDGEVAAHACADRFTSAPQLCLGSQLYRHEWLQRPACSPHAHRRCACCCYPKYPTCTCCWDPKCPDWWSLTPTATVYVRGKKEDGEDTSLSSRRREIPTRERSRQLSSSSESEEETEESLDDDDDDSDQETWLSKTTLSTTVDSGVNTDSSLWDKPQADISERPEWKYWRRSPPEPFHRKPGHGEKKMKGRTSKADSGVSWVDGAGSTNQSALFERIADSPGKSLTVRDVLVHQDFHPSDARSAPPAVERLGESEAEKLRRKQAVLETRKEKIIKHREWEEKREQNEDQKYSDGQEAHRVKTLQRLKHEDVKLKEKASRAAQSMKAKQEARESNSLRLQTIAAEDKQKEQRRMEHLRHVREKIDQREFEKCAANERREIKQEEARRRKVNDRYRDVAEKVALAEKQETRGGIRIQAETYRGPRDLSPSWA